MIIAANTQQQSMSHSTATQHAASVPGLVLSVEGSASDTQLAHTSGILTRSLVKAAVNTTYGAFKLAVPMIPAPAGDIVALIVGVAEQAATVLGVSFHIVNIST